VRATFKASATDEEIYVAETASDILGKKYFHRTNSRAVLFGENYAP
jgi:hypothetical protein